MSISISQRLLELLFDDRFLTTMEEEKDGVCSYL